MQEIKDILESQGKAFEAFKETNDKRLAALEENGHVPSEITEKLAKIEADMKKQGEDYADALKKAQRPALEGDEGAIVEQFGAMNAFARNGDRSGIADVQRKMQLNSTSDTDGGVLVLPELDKVIDRVVPTISALARLAKVVNIGTGKYRKLVKTSGLTMSWPGDGAGDGESTNPKYSALEIDVHVGEVEPWVDNTTLEDAEIDIAADLAEEAGIGFGAGIGGVLITGTGVGQPRGLTAYTAVANASYAWGSLGYVASGGAGAFTSSAPADKIVGLQHALKQQYRSNACFLMADTTLSTIRQMKDSSGQYYLWNPDPLVGFGGRLLGSPVEIDDNMPVVAANSLSIAYGDFRQAYTVVNRRGTTLIRDNLTTKGKTKFNFTRRVGGDITNFEAVKLMKFAAS